MNKSLLILGQLADEHGEWIATHGLHRVVAAGETIIHMDVSSDSVFFLLDGEMSVIIDGIGEIAKLKSADIIGEMSLVDPDSKPSATVTAKSESVLLEVPKHVLNEKIARDVSFAADFYRAIAIFLADRMRSLYLATHPLTG